MHQTTSRDRIPLPDHLTSGECGCLWAPSGRHLVSCVPAREYDTTPLQEHPDFEMGRSFQAISWQYPLRLEATVRVEVEVDPIAYIVNHREDYDAFVLQPGFEEWEKPIAFLAERLEEGCDMGSAPFGHPRHESRITTYFDGLEDRPRWGPEDTEALHAALPSKVDPNQEVLL